MRHLRMYDAATPQPAKSERVSWRRVAWAVRASAATAVVVGVVLFVQDVGGRWVSLCVVATLLLGWISGYAMRRNSSHSPKGAAPAWRSDNSPPGRALLRLPASTHGLGRFGGRESGRTAVLPVGRVESSPEADRLAFQA